MTTAILAGGNALQEYSVQTITERRKFIEAEITADCCKELSQASRSGGMVAGQQMDLDTEGIENSISKN
jgi:geranylgeranyl pyrophosphate synthase